MAVSTNTNKAQGWKIALRPHTLPAAAAPVLVACSISWYEGKFSLLPALAAFLCALMVQTISNLVNDVMDFHKGADTDERVGFQRATQSGLLTPKEIWLGTAFCILLAAAAGGYIVWLRGGWALLIGILSILSAAAYTAGPYPLAYNGFGDIFVLVFFGFVNLCGSVFAIMGTIPPISWVMAFNMGALITAILVVNNIRDMKSDEKAGRRNIPVVLGRDAALWEYRILLLLPYLSLIGAALFTWQYFLLLPLLTIPQAVGLMRDLRDLNGAALNNVLARSGKLVLLYGMMLSVGFLLS